MTTSPPIERLWIAAAAAGGKVKRSQHRSSVAGARSSASPCSPAEDRPDATSTMGRSDPTPSTSILGPDHPSGNEPLLGPGDRPDGPSVMGPGGWHHQMTNSARPETPTEPLS